MRRFKYSFPVAVLTLLGLAACDDDTTGIDEDPIVPSGAAVISADITSNRTLYADTVYTLRGFIHVANGATLTIQPGTIIQGDFNTLGSSLFILRGARIVANGTAVNPIVFTSSRPAGQRQSGDWGGLIIVGNGTINRSGADLEGTGGVGNPTVTYSGGNNNADASGSLRYVRIEFAGYATAVDAELNALTLAAVGSGTTLEYVQVLAGLDDSFEFFGGTVDGKYLVSYDSGDDHFDMSEGYSGRLQFLIAFQNRLVIPRPAAGNPATDPQGIENDGCNGTNCTSGQNSQPLNLPIVANFTLVGPTTGIFTAGSGGVGMMLRRGTGGFYLNGVVTRWERAAISLRDQTTLDRLAPGNLMVRNVFVSQNGPTFQAPAGTTVQGTVSLSENAIVEATTTAQSLFVALPASPTAAAQLDFTPAASSPIASGGLTTIPASISARAGTFIIATAYRGAADPAGPKWWLGWTNYSVN
jgi:hypothetical protein